MNIAPFDAEQTDVLQEITNIAMGQAGDALAQVLNTFVKLSVPRIRLVEVKDISDTVQHLTDHLTEVSSVRQAFAQRELCGEAIVLFNKGGCNDLADLMGYENNLTPLTERELLLDTSNILIGACLNGIGAQLDLDFVYSPPSLMAENAPIAQILSPENLPWKYAVLVEIKFSLEDKNFISHLLILTAEEAVESLRASLTSLVEAL